MKPLDEYFAANKDLWNQRTAIHKDSSFYDLAGFKAGKRVLTDIEWNELGDVKNKKMLHLQCHFGMDTLDWARAGAHVTGVDLSDAAINEAKTLNEELNMDATFICANVYDLYTTSANNPLQDEAGSFDIVFTSYGTIGWLPDLDRWAEIIAYYLKKGGIFYMADFHPVVWMFDDEFTHVKYYYDNRELIVLENQPTYTGDPNAIHGKEYSWNHSISEILNALIKAGLRINRFNEHNFSPYSNFPNSIETEPGKWQIKGMEGKIPIVYSLECEHVKM